MRKYTAQPKHKKVVANSDKRYSTKSRVVAADEDEEDDLFGPGMRCRLECSSTRECRNVPFPLDRSASRT